MKKVAFLFSILVSTIAGAQQFTIPAEDYPFFDILEWKGNGSMLLNRDPSGLKRKINLTMVGSQTTSIWQESFNPTGKDYFYIHSENARYVYFLEQLQPTEGKISFCQLNIAGNVKNSTALFTPAIKKLGSYDINELKLMDVFTTDKALVYIFRWNDKKEKKFIDLMVTMTHHNMLIYATKIGEVSEANLKNPKYGYWNYAGFEGDKISFSVKDVQGNKSGWSFVTFNSKAELTGSSFMEGPGVTFDQVSTGSFGMTGKYYLNTSDLSGGQLLQLKDQYYIVGMRTDGSQRVIECYKYSNSKWEKINSAPISVESAKKGLFLNTMILNEGIACISGGTSYFLPLEAGKKVVTNPVTKYTPFNPSSVMIESLNNRFAVSLPEGVLFFDTQQLNKAGDVNFEFIKK